jgi:ABC-type enterochelin transport system substrate-binding protein
MTQSLVSRHLPQVLAPVILLAALGAAPATWAQTAAAPATATAATASPAQKPAAIEQHAERIVIEDAGSRIDELRVGGETRTITVQPKGGMPAYAIQPENSGQGTHTGSRGWTVFGF